MNKYIVQSLHGWTVSITIGFALEIVKFGYILISFVHHLRTANFVSFQSFKKNDFVRSQNYRSFRLFCRFFFTERLFNTIVGTSANVGRYKGRTEQRSDSTNVGLVQTSERDKHGTRIQTSDQYKYWTGTF